MQSLAATARPLDIPGPFSPFECKGGVQPQLVDKKFSMSFANSLFLIVRDKPGYSRHSLEGSATISGNASLLLKAGFTASGRCDASLQVKLPVFGWVSVIIMPAVRAGVGVAVSGQVIVVQGELGVEGKVGFETSLGWECGGVAATCRGLDTFTPIKGLKTKSTFPSDNGMQAKISGQFYVLAGLDASLFLGTVNAQHHRGEDRPEAVVRPGVRGRPGGASRLRVELRPEARRRDRAGRGLKEAIRACGDSATPRSA